MVSEPRTGLTRGFTPGRASLVAYLMAGFPDRETSLADLRAAARAGADVIELGVPYGDALADGPVIADAGKAAMEAAGGRFGLAETIALAAEFTAESGVPEAPPVALMTYLNPMLRMGLAKVADASAEADVSGFIVPDMPPDGPMTAPWLKAAGSRGLDTVFLAAPTSTPERIRKVAAASRGFVYCVSSVGVTGERAKFASGLADLVAEVKASTRLPVAVGFGISTPEQAGEISKMADGVVVGSAIVRRQRDPDELAEFVQDLCASMYGERSTEDV